MANSPRVIGYVRVSTDRQDAALQRDALAVLSPFEIVEDIMSGSRADRPGLTRALAMLQPGDTLAVWKLDRLGRSLKQLIDTGATIESKGAALKSMTESIDTATAAGKVLFHVLGALAEFEKETIRERVIAGMAVAKRAGKHVGRPAKMTKGRTEEAREWLANGKSWNEVSDLFNISQATLSRALQRYPEGK